MQCYEQLSAGRIEDEAKVHRWGGGGNDEMALIGWCGLLSLKGYICSNHTRRPRCMCPLCRTWWPADGDNGVKGTVL